MSQFWHELQRRNVIKAAIAYIAISWLLLQVFSIVLPTLDAPSWVMRVIMLFMAIGFPLWIFFSWVYEVTPEGLKKTSEVEIDQSITAKTNKRLSILIFVTLSLVLLLTVFYPNRDLIKTKDGRYAIAVLYFDNMSPDDDNTWISDGMTESISTKLEHNKNLLVSGRTSVKQFKDSDAPIPEIAKKLGVSYILEGSVRRHNNKALITAQLINSKNQHVWANEYNVNLDDILGVQSTIASQIVSELKIVLSPPEKEEMENKATHNLEAYKLFLKAMELADTRTLENINRAYDLFKKATDLDTLFAEAYAEQGHMLYWKARLGGPDIENSLFDTENSSFKEIKKLSTKALALNPKTSRAYSILALRMLIGPKEQYNYEEYVGYYEKALEINPNDDTTLMQLADAYRRTNKNKALQLISEALRINPLSVAVNRAYIGHLLGNNKIELAEAFFNEKKYLFDNKLESRLFNDILTAKGEIESENNKDWTKTINIYEKALSTYPSNYRLLINLATAYDGILNDNRNYIKYTRLAYELDSTQIRNLVEYCTAIIEGRQFARAEKLIGSKNYLKVLRPFDRKFLSWYLHYNKGEHEKSLEIITDSIFGESSHMKLLTMAQLDKKDDLLKVFKEENVDNTTKAFVYAILEERDSMYQYLNQDDIDYKYINSRFEFDPYRKEGRFKEFLIKNYLPLTHWNE